MPTLETPEGGIFESNAIARYIARLADKGLYGTTAIQAVRAGGEAGRHRLDGSWQFRGDHRRRSRRPRFVKSLSPRPCGFVTPPSAPSSSRTRAQGQVEQWIDFATNELDAPLMSWVLPLAHVWPYDAKVRGAGGGNPCSG